MTENTGNDVKNTENIGIEAYAMDKYRNLPPDQKEIVKFRANKTVELLKERQKKTWNQRPYRFQHCFSSPSGSGYLPESA